MGKAFISVVLSNKSNLSVPGFVFMSPIRISGTPSF